MRWEVFKQDAPGKPHQAVGSVHADDAETALLNARHVFARRPTAVGLWVAPADAVSSWSAEQVARRQTSEGGSATSSDDARREAGEREQQARLEPDRQGPVSTYRVFVKASNRRSMTFVEHVGEVRASGPLAALEQALQRFPAGSALVWWLVPEEAISATAPEDTDSWFEPARDKTYKQQSAYGRVRPGARSAP